MKCPYCDQEMIDRKEFCINCGKKLYEEKGVSKLSLIVTLILMIIVGIVVCYLIINLNTDEEIAPYIDKTTEISE